MELTTPMVYSPARGKNEDKYGILSGPQCVCCMKPLKGEYYGVHMGALGELIDTSIDEADVKRLTGQESQGWFDIGKTCSKKFESRFIFKQS